MPALVVDGKEIGDGWTKLIDYAYTGVLHWLLEVDGDRDMEVGMGLFLAGQPRGEKKRFRGRVNFWTLGAGRVVARTREGSGRVRVKLWRDFEEIRPDGGLLGVARELRTDLFMTPDFDLDFERDEVSAAVEGFNEAAGRLAAALDVNKAPKPSEG